jgi:amino acid adenylation domain-containing protein
MAKDPLSSDKCAEPLVQRLAGLSPAKRALLTRKLATAPPVGLTIHRRADNEPLQLSFAQERIWFLSQFSPESPAYNVPRALRLYGSLDEAALRRAIDAILTRHEVLRTCYITENGSPIPRIIPPPVEIDLRVVDLRSLGDSASEVERQRLITEAVRAPFDLSRDLMLRALLLHLAEEEHILLLVSHHIASDALSGSILLRELAAFYSAFTTGTSPSLPELPIQYMDYALWQRKRLQGQALQQQLAYWRKQLAGAPMVLELPTDYPRPPIQSFRGAKQYPRFSKEVTTALKDLSRQEGATLFMTLLAAYATLLHRYTAQEDILIGTPIAGRNFVETEPLIGLFINMLVLRVDLSGNPTFRELLGRVRRVVLDAFDHPEVPLEKLVEELQPERDLRRSPMVQVSFVLDPPRPQVPQIAGTKTELLDIDTGVAKDDLILGISEEAGGLAGKLEYSTDLFAPETIARLLGNFETLLQNILADPDGRIGHLNLLTDKERHQLLVEWNRTEIALPEDQCIHRLFAAQAARLPEAIAAECMNNRITYRELNARANQLAHYLGKLGVGPEVLVGIYIERSIEMMIGLLGIMKAGGAYVPLDPAYPQERLEFMMQDAGVQVLVTQRDLRNTLTSSQVAIVCLDTDWEKISQEPCTDPQTKVLPHHLAYVIYTSGSTGRPKGVQLPHRAVVNFLCHMHREPGMSEQDAHIGVASMSFDASVLDFYVPLTSGAKLIIATREEASDGRALMHLIEKSGATSMHATPATWRMLLDSGWEGNSGLKVLCGGDALTPDIAKPLVEKCASVWNLYGPTETAVYSTVEPIRTVEGPIFVGRPIANTRIYLLDKHLQPVPIGVAGEVCIGGTGVARGYLHRPELTAEKFLPDSFHPEQGAYLYRTGDLARYWPDGKIECLGRMDRQIKLRGYRIELGEIEALIGKYQGVHEAIVILREDVPGEKRLVAYLVPNPNEVLDIGALRQHLQEKLPEYMVPSAFVTMEALPLSPNNKVDRRALPPPELWKDALTPEYVAPRTPTEQKLAEIWAEVLKVNQVGVYDNFFELGGHSLLATRVIARIRESLGIELPVRSLFESPTLGGLALVITQWLAMMKGEEKIRALLEKVAHL